MAIPKKVRIIPFLGLIMACKANIGVICMLIMLWKIRLAGEMLKKMLGGFSAGTELSKDNYQK